MSCLNCLKLDAELERLELHLRAGKPVLFCARCESIVLDDAWFDAHGEAYCEPCHHQLPPWMKTPEHADCRIAGKAEVRS